MCVPVHTSRLSYDLPHLHEDLCVCVLNATGTRVQLPSPPLFEARSRPMTEARVTSPAGPTARARLLLHGSPMHSGSTSSGIGAATTAGTTDVPTTASGMPRAGVPPPPPLPAPQPPRAPAPSRALAPSLGGMTLDDLLGGVGDEGSVLHVHRNTHSQRAPKVSPHTCLLHRRPAPN